MTVNTPHLAPPVELLPTRTAIVPVTEALLMAPSSASVRLTVPETAPALVLLTDGSLTMVDPTTAHVPFEMTSGTRVDAPSPVSPRVAAPAPLASPATATVPFAPEVPTRACHAIVTVAAPTTGGPATSATARTIGIRKAWPRAGLACPTSPPPQVSQTRLGLAGGSAWSRRSKGKPCRTSWPPAAAIVRVRRRAHKGRAT